MPDRVNHTACLRVSRHIQFLVAVVLWLSLLLVPAPSAGQVVFERLYGGTGNEGGEDVVQTVDGGYIVAGWTSRAGNIDAYLMKTDSLGNAIWTRTYGDTADDVFRAVCQTSDGGYAAAGVTNSFGAGWADVYLVTTDANGDTLWTRTYGGSGYEYGYALQQTLDGGYIIVGETGAGGADVYVVKTDSAGDTLWTRVYGEFQDDKCYSVDHAWGGGYILGGYRRTTPQYLDDFYLLRIDTLGYTLWTRTYNIAGYDKGYCVRQAWDGWFGGRGGYIFAGELEAHFRLIRADDLGDTLWTRNYGGGECYSVDQTWMGGYILGGWSERFTPGYSKVYLLETGPWGQIGTEWVYGFPFSWARGYSVKQTIDGGYIAVGRALVADSTRHQVYLIKTPGYGGEFHNGAVIALDSPGDTVLPDSIYPVKATVRNFGNTTESFDVFATIDGYTDVSHVSGLRPRSAAWVTFGDWQVPSADSTSYTMTVYTQVWGDFYAFNDTMTKTIFACNPTIGVEEGTHRASVRDFRLCQNEPNPFYRSTGIGYSLPTSCHVTLTVYDVAGRPLTTLVSKEQGPGVRNVAWDGGTRASGVYFYRLEAGSFVDTKKMVLAR